MELAQKTASDIAAMAPGSREPYHTHRRPCLMFDTVQSAIAYRGPSGTVLFNGEVFNSSAPLFGDSLPPELIHSVQSTTTLGVTYHAIRIEFKPRVAVSYYYYWPVPD